MHKAMHKISVKVHKCPMLLSVILKKRFLCFVNQFHSIHLIYFVAIHASLSLSRLTGAAFAKMMKLPNKLEPVKPKRRVQQCLYTD